MVVFLVLHHYNQENKKRPLTYLVNSLNSSEELLFPYLPWKILIISSLSMVIPIGNKKQFLFTNSDF